MIQFHKNSTKSISEINATPRVLFDQTTPDGDRLLLCLERKDRSGSKAIALVGSVFKSQECVNKVVLGHYPANENGSSMLESLENADNYDFSYFFNLISQDCTLTNKMASINATAQALNELLDQQPFLTIH